MFLLKSIDLIALIGLFVQAFVAWVFVAVLLRMRRSEHASEAFGDFHRAFLALAAALTLMSVRFFQTHEMPREPSVWEDGRWAAVTCYVAYNGLKSLFGLYLVRGSYRLVDRGLPAWLTLLWWPLVLAMSAAPLLVLDINALLLLQAPLMIGCALLALLVLPRSSAVGSGLTLVRFALIGLAVSWGLHALAASNYNRFPAARYVLSLNSFIDLGVQLTLGTGLIVSLLQEAHARLRAAEADRERLQRELDRDEKLRALGTLVSGVAHELNNPLTVIMGYADLLGGPGREHAARIVGEQAERCRAIVRNLSALAGQSQHPLQDLAAADLVDRVARGLSPVASPEGPTLRIAEIGALRLNADRVGMEQVLTNLIVNAMQASPPRGEVLVEALGTAAGTEFRVTDAGPGIRPEHRPRLFEPFFTTKAPGQGTGLGLSIAHAIVRAHGGSIRVEDGPQGRGARFSVLIPHTPAGPQAPRKAQPQQRTQGRLLIIDDDAAVRSALRGQAERRGWSVFESSSAEAALENASGFAEVDAVLCDLRMPGMGGIGLHDRLQLQNPGVLRRFVFVTGDLASEESAGFSQRCARPLVQKPFDFDELFACLARAHAGGAEPLPGSPAARSAG